MDDWSMKDYATIIALIAGPVIAVIITLWHQSRTSKRQAKQKLFLNLMSYRKSWPPSPEWVNSLNLIDVVYYDSPPVIRYWRVLYEVIVTRPWNAERYTHAHLDLLSAMAKDVGYKGLNQTDIDKFYAPEALGEVATRQTDTQKEFLRVLKASENFGEPRKSE